MEPTGSSWIPVTHWLIAQGYTVYLLKPDKSYALRQFYHKHTKTDLLDAEVLAKVPLVDSEGVFPYQAPSEKVTALKQLGKTRQMFVDLTAAQEKRIQALCDQLLPGWRRQLKGKQLVGEMGKAFFQEYADLSKVEKTEEEAFYQVLASASSPAGLKKISIFRSLALKAHAFHLKTHGEQNTRLFYESLWQELKPLLELIRFAEKQAEQLEKEMVFQYSSISSLCRGLSEKEAVWDERSPGAFDDKGRSQTVEAGFVFSVRCSQKRRS
jgi:hypothetical protein